MLKKISILVFTLILSVVIFAQEMVDVENYVKEPPYVVGYDIYFVGNTWSMQLYWEFKQAVEDNRDLIKEVYYTESEGNAAKQVANLQDLIARDVDVIIVTPVSPSAVVPVIKKALSKGIVVILAGSESATKDYTAYVNADDFEFGRIGAQWLVDKLGGKGNIVAVSGMAGISTAERRWEGAMSVFKNYPEISILAHEYADWAYDKAKMVAQNLIATYPQIDGVWSGGGAMTMAFMEVFLSAGRKLVPMTGEDNNGFLKMWKLYQPLGFDSIACSKPTWLSAKALEVALEILQGKPVPKDNIIPVPTITSENLDDFVRFDLPDSFWCNSHLSENMIKEMFQR